MFMYYTLSFSSTEKFHKKKNTLSIFKYLAMKKDDENVFNVSHFFFKNIAKKNEDGKFYVLHHIRPFPLQENGNKEG